jgi:phage shock protein E
MKTSIAFVASLLALAAPAGAQAPMPNPLIDYREFLGVARRVEAVRESRRLSEDAFLRMMAEPGVVVLDARSAAKFALRHVRGAVNLSLPDFTAAELARIIPAKDTTVLIYCNNNFLGSPASFASKLPAASLNISTYVNLATYGYTNVYELGPLVDVRATRLPFEGAEVSR